MANPMELRPSVNTIQDFTKLVFEGKAFKMSQTASSANIFFQFTVPEGVYVLVNKIVFSSAAAQACTLVEDPTKTTGTTAITPVNLNRTSSGASALTSKFTDPTGISAGTEVARVNGIGGVYDTPVLLKPLSTYILTATTATSLQMYWSEVS